MNKMTNKDGCPPGWKQIGGKKKECIKAMHKGNYIYLYAIQPNEKPKTSKDTQACVFRKKRGNCYGSTRYFKYTYPFAKKLGWKK